MKTVGAVILLIASLLLVGIATISNTSDSYEAKLASMTANATYYQEQSLYWQKQCDPLRDFASLGDLKAWLAQDKTDEIPPHETTFDCDDYARTLQRHALQEGYLINCEYLFLKEGAHVVNTAVIGNCCYWIEPQTDKTQLYYYLD